MSYRARRKAIDLSVEDTARWLDTVPTVKQDLRDALRDCILSDGIDGRQFSSLVKGNGLFGMDIAGLDQASAQRIRRAWTQDFPDSANVRESSDTRLRSHRQSPGQGQRATARGASTPALCRDEDRDRSGYDSYRDGCEPDSRHGSFANGGHGDRHVGSPASAPAQLGQRSGASQELSSTGRSAPPAKEAFAVGAVELLQAALDRVAECGNHRRRDVYLWVQDVLPQDVWMKLWECSQSFDGRRGSGCQPRELREAWHTAGAGRMGGEDELVSFSRREAVPTLERAFPSEHSSDAGSDSYYGSPPSRPSSRPPVSTTPRSAGCAAGDRAPRPHSSRASEAESHATAATAWLDDGSALNMSPEELVHLLMNMDKKVDNSARQQIGRYVLKERIDGATFESKYLTNNGQALTTQMGVILRRDELAKLVGSLTRAMEQQKAASVRAQAARANLAQNRAIARTRVGKVGDKFNC